jgi:four helix bundle protein
MGTVEEEADETMYWIELSIDASLVTHRQVADLLAEADEILSIVVSSIKTARGQDRNA